MSLGFHETRALVDAATAAANALTNIVIEFKRYNDRKDEERKREIAAARNRSPY